jgi:hypothetical protein
MRMCGEEYEEFESVECVECEQWFDENYVGICRECDEAICPRCEPIHRCAIAET